MYFTLTIKSNIKVYSNLKLTPYPGIYVWVEKTKFSVTQYPVCTYSVLPGFVSNSVTLTTVSQPISLVCNTLDIDYALCK